MDTYTEWVIIGLLLFLVMKCVQKESYGCGMHEGYGPPAHARGGQSPRPTKSTGDMKWASLGITQAPGKGYHRGWAKKGGPKGQRGDWSSVDWDAN